jgi:hypothetical protein
MLNLSIQFFTFIYVTIKRILASFILTKILGWEISKNYNTYFQYRKGRHVWIYAHTSTYDGILGYLAYVAYDIPVVGVAKMELSQLPVLGYFMRKMDVVFIDRIRNTNTAKYISDELDKKKNFVFVISPEGSRHKVKDIRSGFYYIAANTKADLHMISINYETQTIDVNELATNSIIQTTTYDNIKTLVTNEMEKESPYHPEDYHLLNKQNIKTSIINIYRSWLIYLPPLTVLYILFSSLAT